MKTLLLLTFISLSFFQIQAQCTEAASDFGNNTSTPSYNVSGDISIILNTNNTVTLQLGDNFTTAAGPDVRAYLVKSEGRTINQLKSLNPTTLENISFGLVSCSGCNPVISANGAQTLTANIPTNINISDFDTVFFYCLQFTAFWDVGSFTPFSTNNCAVLDIDTFAVDDISIYPNPATDKIQIANLDDNSIEVRIFNLLGKQVFYQPNLKENSIDISQFNKGVYMLRLVVDGKSRTQKLVIQ